MGTVHTIENHLTAISRTIRRVLVSYSERQNIQKKRKLIDKVSLTETQKQEIKEFFRKNYGKSYLRPGTDCTKATPAYTAKIISPKFYFRHDWSRNSIHTEKQKYWATKVFCRYCSPE